ncbi:MAG TPA: molybdenum cofactor guanylyltransferase [Candidatus Binataceae bacterium]|nr:molybdenum cofactor guanylyltransferase [Candidatus Binataceae bacterium]
MGGNSSRMGRNKALLPYHGTTLGQSVAETVRAAAGTAALVGGPRHDAPSEFGFVPDLYPGEGPLGGILSALRSSTADWNLMVACDMPNLEADFLRQLLDTADSCGADALVPAGPSGRLEPLCAAYHRKALGSLEAAFARGVRKIATALEEVRAVTWPVPELSCFQNVNTPEEWAPYER